MTRSMKKKSLRHIACPQCGEVGLRKIVYGMPGDGFPFDKVITGGCIIADEDVGCPGCDWVGFKRDLEVR